MIKVKNGEMTLNGTLVEISADIVTAFKALVDHLPTDSDIEMKISQTTVKSMFYSMAQMVREKGIEVSFTESDVEFLNKKWEETFHD